MAQFKTIEIDTDSLNERVNGEINQKIDDYETIFDAFKTIAVLHRSLSKKTAADFFKLQLKISSELKNLKDYQKKLLEE